MSKSHTDLSLVQSDFEIALRANANVARKQERGALRDGVLGVVEQSAPFFGADLRGVVGVGKWNEAYDPDEGVLTRSDDVLAIDAGLENLIRKQA